jgi:hypothetical protein
LLDHNFLDFGKNIGIAHSFPQAPYQQFQAIVRPVHKLIIISCSGTEKQISVWGNPMNDEISLNLIGKGDQNAAVVLERMILTREYFESADREKLLSRCNFSMH